MTPATSEPGDFERLVRRALCRLRPERATQQEVADSMGRHITTIKRYESGAIRMSLEDVDRYLTACDVKPAELLEYLVSLVIEESEEIDDASP